ncbi:MAG: zinc-dependent alcohol dehydrogenase family protein [Thermanaerothrix sp.]|uniref:alcohol dehydrogenase n=1 Tax=Thermanaerothrix solaris TaxID=3058434 RepID=A0ABU3NPA3_9CHLR|nr:zinc-dependent alcohol dehydrogenase family protein [Thermanaerothrix sp. 4228-RoL]MDT8898669.1 zinc-dependent alcohol dehydrogenase family protein [Thermanaerothrix sp. 4228-RoL]
MRVWQVTHAGPIESHPLHLAEIPIPQPGPGQVLLRVRVCGICHTDLHIAEGDLIPPAYPVVPGHQVVGEIVALGEGVSNLIIGQRVGVPWLHQACGACEFCQRGEENLCPSARFTGLHVPGGFAEYLLADANFVLPLPESLNDVEAAPLLCAGIIGYRSLRKAEVQPGERLGLFGFGASAHLVLQVARYWGCDVYVFTRSEAHRQHALELGATWAGRAEDTPPHLLDRAITFAPVGEIIPLALAKLRPGGTLAINAVHLTPIPSFEYPLIYGERTLRSVANATRQDGREFLHLAAQIPIRPTVTLYPFDALNQALADLKHSRLNGQAVLHVE